MAKSTNDILFKFLGDTKSLDRATKGASKGMGNTERSSISLTKAMGALGLAFGAREVLQFGKDAISAASDYEESANAIVVATGDAAGEIERFGKTAATEIGLSKTEVNELAVAFSGFADNVKGDNSVAETFEEYSVRASDFASVLNLETSDAVRIFQSALSGETEPIRRFGIDMSAAAVSAHAVATGVGEAGEALSESEKQAARYSLLMQETAKFSGDFEATSDSLANQQKILNAEWENAQIQLGQQLIPAMQTAIPLLITMAQTVGEMPDDIALASSRWNEFASAGRDAIEDVTFGLIQNTDAWGDNEDELKEVRKQNKRVNESIKDGKTVMEAANDEILRMASGFGGLSEETLKNLQTQLGLTDQEMIDLISTAEDTLADQGWLSTAFDDATEATKFLSQSLNNELTKAMEDDAEAARDLAFDILTAARAEDDLLESVEFLTEAQKEQLGIFELIAQEAREALQKLRNEWNTTTGRVRAYEQAVRDAAAQVDILSGKVPSGGFQTPTGQLGLAGGGTLSTGQTALVGEEGPEIVTAGQSMRVHPNGTNPFGSGGGGSNIYITVNALDPDAAAVAVHDALVSYEDRYGPA